MSILKLFSNLTVKQRRIIFLSLVPIECLSSLLDFLLPKDKNLILFGSDSGSYASGSPKALFEYIQKNHPEYDTYYYSPFKKMSLKARVLYIVNFAPKFFRAKFLVSSHPPKDFFPFTWSRKKFFVNTWHGIPLKAMFFADKGDKHNNLRSILQLNKKTSAFLVSSKLEAALISRCFGIDSHKIVFSGQPKNDYLCRKTFPNYILRKMLKNVPDYDKVILYCPTYRRDAPTIFFPFADLDKDDFRKFLEKNKIIILMREHIYSKSLNQSLFSNRILPFGFDVCNDINSILPETDILVTDYSSVYIDYLLLDKPCIFIPYDLENYNKKRGLLLDYQLSTPGPKVLTYNEFKKMINDILLASDDFKIDRQKLRNKFHEYQTNNSCQGILKLINYWKNLQ